MTGKRATSSFHSSGKRRESQQQLQDTSRMSNDSHCLKMLQNSSKQMREMTVQMFKQEKTNQELIERINNMESSRNNIASGKESTEFQHCLPTSQSQPHVRWTHGAGFLEFQQKFRTSMNYIPIRPSSQSQSHLPDVSGAESFEFQQQYRTTMNNVMNPVQTDSCNIHELFIEFETNSIII